MLIDFEEFLLQIDWDLGVDFGDPILSVELFPSVVLVADFTIVVDFWWNSGFNIDLPPIPFPAIAPTPCLGIPGPIILEGTVHLNPVPDYTENKQIHLLPWTPAFDFTFNPSGEFCLRRSP